MTLGRARVLLLGGFESSGSVGLLADVAAVLAAHAHPLPIVTSVTAQSTRSFVVAPMPPKVLVAQLAAELERGRVQAMKLGVVPGSEWLRRVRARRELQRVPWVVDPVVRSSTGGKLSKLAPRDFLGLAQSNVCLTPNALEAGWLLGRPAPEDPDEAEAAGRALLAEGFGSVVVKGGHLRGPPVDVVVWKGSTRWLRSASRRESTLRGTGCRFGAFLAARLAQGHDPEQSARSAHLYLAGLFRSGKQPTSR